MHFLVIESLFHVQTLVPPRAAFSDIHLHCVSGRSAAGNRVDSRCDFYESIYCFPVSIRTYVFIPDRTVCRAFLLRLCRKIWALMAIKAVRTMDAPL